MADNDDMAGIHQAIAETAQQINEDVTTRYRAAAIALRQGQQVEQRNLNSSSTAPVEAKRPLNLAPKGIPMSLILSTDPDEGEPVRFAPGELQVEEAKQQAAETRLPTLPHLPAIAEPTFMGTDMEHQQLENAERGPFNALGARGYEDRTCSTLEANAGFYLRCKKFLPKASPEQHFQVFGVSRPLSKEEWENFVHNARSRDEN